MLTIRQLLPTTPRIWSVTPDMPIADATALMARQGIESLLVLEGGTLRGMLTTEDCATNVPTPLPTTQGIQVRSVMRQTTEAVRPEATIAACAQWMATAHLHHVPVMDADGPIGIVSLSEVTRALVRQLTEQEFLVTQFENYITGRRA